MIRSTVNSLSHTAEVRLGRVCAFAGCWLTPLPGGRRCDGHQAWVDRVEAQAKAAHHKPNNMGVCTACVR